MYFVSLLINSGTGSISYEINIIDGQNATQIAQYDTTIWDPCIPMTFYSSAEITIIFNSDNIQNFNDWYPKEVCGVNNNTFNYQNEYLFDGAASLFIQNLIVNNYVITNENDRQYLFIRSTDYYAAYIQCHNCSFINISSSNSNPFFDTLSSIVFYNSQFINVSSSSDIIYAQHLDLENAARTFAIWNTVFSYVTANTILTTTQSTDDVK